jgi:single-strand DNA-binding protein
MSQDNQITLRGFLTAEPKLFQKTSTAVPVTEIRVGSTPRRLNRETGEWQDQPTSYYRVKCWRRLAINAVSSLHKGDMVVVRGRFYMANWVDSQQRQRATLEIEADSLGHDLTYGWSHFLRGTRPSGGRADVDAGELARQDAVAPDPGDSDDEYPPDIYAGESQEAASDLDGQEDAEYTRVVADPLAAMADTPVTNGEDGRPSSGGMQVASSLTSDASPAETDTETETREADAVAF